MFKRLTRFCVSRWGVVFTGAVIGFPGFLGRPRRALLRLTDFDLDVVVSLGGVELTVVSCSPEGFLDPADVEAALQPNTVMIALNHASNVVGTLLPVGEVGRLVRERDVLLLVDAAQTGGAYPIDVQAQRIDLLAFTGHKSLLGPMGTGGLIVGERVDLDRLRPLKRGGTRSNSELEEQLDFLPDMGESGTPNAVELAGLALGAGAAGGGHSVPRGGDDAAADRRPAGHRGRDGLRRAGCPAADGNGVVQRGRYGALGGGVRLDEQHGILCRVGLHCAPAAYKTIGTCPDGTVRFGLSVFNPLEEVEEAVGSACVSDVPMPKRRALEVAGVEIEGVYEA